MDVCDNTKQYPSAYSLLLKMLPRHTVHVGSLSTLLSTINNILYSMKLIIWLNLILYVPFHLDRHTKMAGLFYDIQSQRLKIQRNTN